MMQKTKRFKICCVLIHLSDKRVKKKSDVLEKKFSKFGNFSKAGLVIRSPANQKIKVLFHVLAAIHEIRGVIWQNSGLGDWPRIAISVKPLHRDGITPVSYTHLRAHETGR